MSVSLIQTTCLLGKAARSLSCYGDVRRRISSRGCNRKSVTSQSVPGKSSAGYMMASSSHVTSSSSHVTAQLSCKQFSTSRTQPAPDAVNITFTDRDGDVFKVQGQIGDSLMEVAHKNDIELEGACDGTLSCCTCHLVVHPDWYPKLGTEPCEDEEDMLDMAYGLTDTSRLGCQIKVGQHLEGIVVKIPPYEPQYT